MCVCGGGGGGEGGGGEGAGAKIRVASLTPFFQFGGTYTLLFASKNAKEKAIGCSEN